MSQLPLFVAIHVVGLIVGFAVGPGQRPALRAALGFPVGLVVVVASALLVLIVGLPHRAGTAAVVAAIVAAAAVVAVRRAPTRRDVAVAGLWTAGFALLATALCIRNVVLTTNDSHTLLMLAVGVGNDGALPPDTVALLDEWGVFQVIAQSLAVFTRQDFLYALPVVLGLSFVPVFALTLSAAPPRRSAAIVALFTVALFTINMVDYHIVYLHTNFATAIYLFGFVVLFWLAELEREPGYVPLAFLSLLGFALQRAENPLVALVFEALCLGPSTLPRRAIAPWFGVFTAVLALWYEVLARHVSDEGSFLTPLRCHGIAATLVLAFGWWLASHAEWARAINRRLPLVLAIGAVLLLAAAFASRPDHMVRSADVWLENLRSGPYWGFTWYGIPLLLLLALRFDPPPFRAAFVVGIPVFFAIGLVLAYLGPGYRLGTGDSANRMTIHIVPLLFWYLAVKLPVAAVDNAGSAAYGRRPL
jgi:hypothetical protein